MKGRWEDLKKNISINPQGNRVRFVPIVPNNASRLTTLPQHSSRSMIFKPFIPKHMANNNNNNATENINYTKYNSKEGHVMLGTQTRFNMKNPRSVSLQVSQKQQEVKENNISTVSLVDKCNMSLLGNSLPKFPLRTIWTNNSLTDFECTLPPKSNPFRKPSSSGLDCLPQSEQRKNYTQTLKFQNKTPMLPNPLNTVNNSSYFKLPYPPSLSSSQKLYPISENMSTSDIETSFSTGQDLDSFSTNQPFNINNINDIWKDYPKM